VFSSAAVSPLFIPWDFLLVLLFLVVIVPWRGARRMRRLLAKPELTSRDRISLYASTILLQWLILAVVAVVCARRSVGPDELGLAAVDPWRIAWVTVALTGIFCMNQVFGIRKITSLPPAKRGSLFAISEKIMPRNRIESLAYAALACTAGVSEEFIYRGFVFMAFLRMAVNYGSPNGIAAVLSSVWFSLAHLYQGRRGIITTFVVGMVFALVRIWAASLIPAVVAHAGMDLTIGICASKFLRKTTEQNAI
jgi:membrane protease YdiL (CAAX protease family)